MRFDDILFCFFIIWYGCGVILLSFNLLPSWLERANEPDGGFSLGSLLA
jgi:bisanhydrobacterioruberin hydratase